MSSSYPRRPRRLATIGIRTNVNLEQSYQEVRREPGRLDARPAPDCAAEGLEEEFGLERPLPRSGRRELRQLHRDEHEQPPLPRQSAAAAGRQLRDRPQGDGRALGRVRRSSPPTSTCQAASRASTTSPRTRPGPTWTRRAGSRRETPGRRAVEVLLQPLRAGPGANGARAPAAVADRDRDRPPGLSRL